MEQARFERIKCDWNGTSCTQLSVVETIPRGDYGGSDCDYLNVLNSGDPCSGACRLKDYADEERAAAMEFKRQLSSGEINLHE